MSRQDMDAVLDEAVKLAVRLLEKSAEFYPFAIAKAADGEIVHVQGWMEEDNPTSDKVIALLEGGLREGAKAGRYRTSALVSDVRLRDRETGVASDAIRVALEDLEEEPVTCYLPYAIDPSGVTLGETMAEKGAAVVFL